VTVGWFQSKNLSRS